MGRQGDRCCRKQFHHSVDHECVPPRTGKMVAFSLEWPRRCKLDTLQADQPVAEPDCCELHALLLHHCVLRGCKCTQAVPGPQCPPLWGRGWGSSPPAG